MSTEPEVLWASFLGHSKSCLISTQLEYFNVDKWGKTPNEEALKATKLVRLGEISDDCRCTGRTRYCTTEDEPNREAVDAAFKAKAEAMGARIDSYYSQPWV